MTDNIGAELAERKKCPVCHGKGYIRCDCWPGDCICAYGDEDCEYCGGTGDDEWEDGPYDPDYEEFSSSEPCLPPATRQRSAQMTADRDVSLCEAVECVKSMSPTVSPWTPKNFPFGADLNDALATILNAVASGAMVPADDVQATANAHSSAGTVFTFDRYINGQLMAEGVCIETAKNLTIAMARAAKLASKGPNGEVPVLILAAWENRND